MDLHPFLVHFPLVLVLLGPAVDRFAITSGQRHWHGPAFLLLVMGTAASLAALAIGNAAAAVHPRGWGPPRANANKTWEPGFRVSCP